MASMFNNRTKASATINSAASFGLKRNNTLNKDKEEKKDENPKIQMS